MFSFIVSLILLSHTQGDLLDLIYNNFYQNQRVAEKIEVITDKDFYFLEEEVSFFIKVNSVEVIDSLCSKWAYVFLFDSNKKVINHSRFFLNDGLGRGSLFIPDSSFSKRIYLSIYTSNSPPTMAKSLYLIDGKKDYVNIEEPKNEITVKTKNRYLLPNRRNTLSISNYNNEGRNIAIIDQNNQVQQSFWIRKRKIIDFEPSINQKYYLKIDTNKIELPEVHSALDLSAFFENNMLGVSFNNLESTEPGDMILVCSGKELLWLSRVQETPSNLTIPINKVDASFIFCFLINQDFELLDKDIFEIKKSAEKIDIEESNDSLILNIPKPYQGLPFVAKLVESEYELNRLEFSRSEVDELRHYGRIPNNLYFKNQQEKLNWLNYTFEINIKNLLLSNDLSPDKPIDSMIFHLPTNVRLDDHLRINAVDFSGKIIDYKRVNHKIFIDPNQFDSQESLLMLSAYYKKRKLKLRKDSLSIIRVLENYADSLIRGEAYLKNLAPDDDVFFDQIKKGKSITILDEVTVSGNEYRVNYPGRGRTKSFNELKVEDDAYTAISLLPQMGIFTKPGSKNGWIYSSRGYFISFSKNSLFRHAGHTVPYPRYLIISDIYSGYDFRVLARYPAKWVQRITKIDKQPEGVIVVLQPGIRGEDNFIHYDKIFKELELNSGSGVLYWNYNNNETVSQIKIPTKGSESVTWDLIFFDSNNEIHEHNGLYEPSKIK